MDGILSAWLKLVGNIDELCKALDSGFDGIVHTLGEYADDAVQGLVPAYATAVAICKQVVISVNSTTAFD
jgi:hypothetical protein